MSRAPTIGEDIEPSHEYYDKIGRFSCKANGASRGGAKISQQQIRPKKEWDLT